MKGWNITIKQKKKSFLQNLLKSSHKYKLAKYQIGYSKFLLYITLTKNIKKKNFSKENLKFFWYYNYLFLTYTHLNWRLLFYKNWKICFF